MGPATVAARGFCIVFLAAWVGAQVRADFSLLACVFLLQLSQPPARAVFVHARTRPASHPTLRLYAQDDNPSWQAYVVEDQEPPVSIFFPNITVPDSGLTERKSSLDGGCLLPADLSCSSRLYPSVGVFPASVPVPVPVSVSASVPWFAPGAASSPQSRDCKDTDQSPRDANTSRQTEELATMLSWLVWRVDLCVGYLIVHLSSVLTVFKLFCVGASAHAHGAAAAAAYMLRIMLIPLPKNTVPPCTPCSESSGLPCACGGCILAKGMHLAVPPLSYFFSTPLLLTAPISLAIA